MATSKKNGSAGRPGKWVDKLEALGRKWSTIYKGRNAKAAQAVSVTCYAARRRRKLPVELRRDGALLEGRRV